MKKYICKGEFKEMNSENNLSFELLVNIKKPIYSEGDASFLTVDIEDHIETENTKNLYKILSDFFSFGSLLFSDPKTYLAQIKDQLGTIVIETYDEQKLTETWNLIGVWPHAINFGEMCYSSDDKMEVNITWGFNDYFIKFH